ncbi:MAG: autotransporter-associated beta strand repeat-containing protein [Chthoniobacterales bacterium]|nr:autotransporter-associated beta strand repeat-containing protein [Chthoniobacterales bacterium]
MKHSIALHCAVFAVLLVALGGPALAQNEVEHPRYTWDFKPENGDWNNPANWTPEGAPDTQKERAVLGRSQITTLTVAPDDFIASVEFTPGADRYTINGGLFFNDLGVINNSGVVQTFDGDFGFDHGAAAGSLVIYNVTGFVDFIGDAGSGTFNIATGARATFFFDGENTGNGGSATFNNAGSVSFFKDTHAGQATFINYGGDSFGAQGASFLFSRAFGDSSTIILNGGSVFGARGARMFLDKSSLFSATVVANGGAGGAGSGGEILFNNSGGNSARVEVFGNGSIDFSRRDDANNSIGSVEGDGTVYLGDGTLTIGSNNLNTSFGGSLTETGGAHGGGPGAISKTGTGTLTLTSANDYSGGTTVGSGSLFVNNTTGSATGSGPVNVVGGALGGTGTISGAVTVGDGSSLATLDPGASNSTIGALTLQATLALDGNSAYAAQIDSDALAADDLIADGVTIGSGVQIVLADLGATILPKGTSFTLINNTSGAAISGTFNNLTDGTTISIGNNTYQANYEGGDGNDLTLTVVP